MESLDVRGRVKASKFLCSFTPSLYNEGTQHSGARHRRRIGKDWGGRLRLEAD